MMETAEPKVETATQGGGRRVLVVEDDAKIAAMLQDYLISDGFNPEWALDGLKAVAAARREDPSAILLDLMLPGLDGLEVCRAVRAFSSVPILMITARVDEIDRLIGLDSGADDYICKPFRPREVLARVRAAVRRAEGRLTRATQAYQIDEAGLRISWRGQWLPLTPHEYRLLKQVMSRPGQVYSRAQLLDILSDDFRDVTDRAVDSHVKNIRKKVTQIDPQADVIASIYGVGYRFDAPA